MFVSFFERILSQPGFTKICGPDITAWNSGRGPKFLAASGFGPRWLNGFPWSFFVAIGNWRAGTSFSRVVWKDVLTDEGKMRGGIDESIVLQAIPNPQPSVLNTRLLYMDDALTMCNFICITLDMVKSFAASANISTLHWEKRSLQAFLCENLSNEHLVRMPWGELPTLVDSSGDVVYGSMNIAEFLCDDVEKVAADSGKPPFGMMPIGANARAHVRKWFGWCKTAWCYQVSHLFWKDVAGKQLLHKFGKDSVGLMEALKTTLGDPQGGRVHIDGTHAIHAHKHALAEVGSDPEQRKAERAPYVEELRSRCEYVDAHLQSTGGLFLEGSATPTLADACVAPIMVLAVEIYNCFSSDMVSLNRWLSDLKKYDAFKHNLANLHAVWSDPTNSVVPVGLVS